ncbi:hypothetical protein VTK73DRAFT_2244 [Phialemonium thermophilum]|uniref:Knl1 C-terminal RWD domain-containing protein n=1 Tax=Phialemonium thermophilum TaxID=223376 RepID=A0ABR3VSF5_9PEZI
MAYRREIEIVFDMASFQPGQPNATIDLWYIAGRRGGSRSNHDDDDDLQRATTDFFLQCIRDKLRGLSQQQTKPARMLSMVRASWDRATTVAKQVRLLNVVFPTTVTRTSDSSVAVRSSLLLEPVATRVEVVLHLHGGGVSSPDDDENDDDENSCGGAVEVAIVPQASVVYGEHFKAGKMAEFLAARIGSRVVGAEEAKRKGIKKAESWCDVVVDLHGKLLSRGKR